MTPTPGSLGYRELAAMLREQIRTRELAPGRPLPAEIRLMQEHGLSRTTVRTAIGLLRAEGLVVTRHGYGTYVREQRDLEPVTTAAGHVTARMPTFEEREQLGVEDGVPVLVLSQPGQDDRILPADRFFVQYMP